MSITLLGLDLEAPGTAVACDAGARASRRPSRRIASLDDANRRQHFARGVLVLARQSLARRLVGARIDAERGENQATRIVARDPTVAVMIEILVVDAGAGRKLSKWILDVRAHARFALSRAPARESARRAAAT